MKRDDKVIIFNGVTRLDIPVNRVIDSAKRSNLTEIVILGFDEDGDFYFGSSKADGADVLWLLEVAKKKLIDITE